VFFEVLLKRFPAVMSDTLQTTEGRDFWIGVVAEAKGRGLHVEMADFSTQQIIPYDAQKNPDILQWLTVVDPWGLGQTYKNRRLIIRR
jgi:hypothetical protein